MRLQLFPFKKPNSVLLCLVESADALLRALDFDLKNLNAGQKVPESHTLKISYSSFRFLPGGHFVPSLENMSLLPSSSTYQSSLVFVPVLLPMLTDRESNPV